MIQIVKLVLIIQKIVRVVIIIHFYIMDYVWIAQIIVKKKIHIHVNVFHVMKDIFLKIINAKNAKIIVKHVIIVIYVIHALADMF